jgi:uncharacterized membrane protein YhhN
MNRIILHLILAFVVISQIVSGIYPFSYDWLNHISKPLIMPLIAIIFLTSYKGKDRVLKIRMLLAMLFSWVGDILLIFQEREPFFMVGLLCFLLAQIMYLSAFLRPQFIVRDIPLLRKMPLIASPFLIFGWLVFTTLRSELGDLKLPVLIYMMAILAMAIFALNRWERSSRKSFYLVFMGALLFVSSDLILAFNKFHDPIFWAGVWIMMTYIGAQYLIARGIAEGSEHQSIG